MTVNFGKLLLLFLVLPFIELYLLLKLSAATSPLFTLATIILTGFLGAFFAKQQGQKVLGNIQREMQLGRLPSDDLIHGLCVLIGGILLLSPGVITDVTGFLLILPVTRIWITKMLKRQFSGVLQKQAVHIYKNCSTSHSSRPSGIHGTYDPFDAYVVQEDDEVPVDVGSKPKGR